MKLLAIETSGASCSAALSIDGEVRQRLEIAPRRHGELILQMMDGLLAEASLRPQDLDAMAFGRGPGSFTGLRIAAAVIQGAAFGADLPVVPVSTLAALAQGCHRRTGAERVLCALDARMEEVYWGAFEADTQGLMRLVGEERVCAPEAASVGDDRVGAKHAVQMQTNWYASGPGWAAYPAPLLSAVGERLCRQSFEALQAICESRTQASPTEVSWAEAAARATTEVTPKSGALWDGQQEFTAEAEARDLVVLAADGLLRGEAVPPDQALPIYLRNQVTAVPARSPG